MKQYTADLLKLFRSTEQPTNAKKIVFNGVEGFDIYNPTAPFKFNGKTYIIGRVEKRDSEHSEAIFFVQQEDGSYSVAEDINKYVLQDPYISLIGDVFIFGGTEIFPHPENPENLWWRAKFYYGNDIRDLKELTVGPNGMKDIRLVGLVDGRIGVFSRPQGEKGGRGKIGFTTIENLEDLNASVIDNAPLLDLFYDEEWGGANEAHLLKNGKIGVLGHIANFSDGDVRHYYPMVFSLDPRTGETSQMEIIAERSNFVDGPAKRDDLIDVLFSAGLIRKNDGTAVLYTGVSDVESQCITIKDPFIKFEG